MLIVVGRLRAVGVAELGVEVSTAAGDLGNTFAKALPCSASITWICCRCSSCSFIANSGGAPHTFATPAAPPLVAAAVGSAVLVEPLFSLRLHAALNCCCASSANFFHAHGGNGSGKAVGVAAPTRRGSGGNGSFPTIAFTGGAGEGVSDGAGARGTGAWGDADARATGASWRFVEPGRGVLRFLAGFFAGVPVASVGFFADEVPAAARAVAEGGGGHEEVRGAKETARLS